MIFNDAAIGGAPSRLRLHLGRLPVLLAAIFCALCIACGIAAEWVAPYGESALASVPWAPPSLAHPLGTDQLGRDMLSRIIYGARTSIGLSLGITLIAFAVGGTLGLAAVSLGKFADQIISRIVDLFMALPPLVLALLALCIFGTSLTTLTLVAALIASLRVFRLTRALGLDIVARDFVDVARLRGESAWWIMWREVLPNAVVPLVAEFGLRFVFAFLFVASLSFLGLGVQPPMADWGGMVRENVGAFNYGRLTPLVPAAFIAALAISVNLLGDWLMARWRKVA